MSECKTHAFYERFIGKEAEVLFEKAAKGKAMHGFTKIIFVLNCRRHLITTDWITNL